MQVLCLGCCTGLPAICVQVVEAGLGYLPFTERTVITPTGHQYVGVDFAKKLCGVSVIRSGESMENALRACCKGIKIGKILVHRWAALLTAALSPVTHHTMHDILLLISRGVHRPTDETHPYHALSGQKAAAQAKSAHAATHGSRPKANGAGLERYIHLHLIVYALHSCQALPMPMTGILQVFAGATKLSRS